ncbi:hypothetical protein [Pustulibacterium marinum]|nr:hypothetical protein [Pustulibacterium marinum]
MKKMICLLVIIFTFSCKENTKPTTKTVSETTTTTKVAISTRQITGNWSVQEHIKEGTSSICNDCPTLSFNEPLSATLTFSDGENEFYTWQFSDEVLSITFLGNEYSEHYIPSGDYSISIKSANAFTTLRLTSSDDEFVLRK